MTQVLNFGGHGCQYHYDTHLIRLPHYSETALLTVYPEPNPNHNLAPRGKVKGVGMLDAWNRVRFRDP